MTAGVTRRRYGPAVRVFRQPLAVRLMNVLAGVGCAALLLLYAFDERGVWALLALLLAALAVAVSVRGWQLRIEVADGEVRFVNWLRVVRVPWADVERFGFDGSVWVRRRDLRQHEAAAFAPVPGVLPFTRTTALQTASALEEMRKKRRRSGGGRDRR